MVMVEVSEAFPAVIAYVMEVGRYCGRPFDDALCGAYPTECRSADEVDLSTARL